MFEQLYKVFMISQKHFQKHASLHLPKETLAPDHTPNEIHRA